MSQKIHFHQTTTLTPEQYIARLTNFGAGRSLFGNCFLGNWTGPAWGKYPPSFSDWSRDAVVCDAWVKRAGYAFQFLEQWRSTMTKWDTRRLTINAQRPTDPEWFDCVEHCAKYAYIRSVNGLGC